MAQAYYVKKVELNFGENKGKSVFTVQPFYYGIIDTPRIARQIAEESALTSADVEAVINRLVFFCQSNLELGYKIKLNGLGTLSVGFVKGKSVDSADKANAKMLKGLRPKFTPEYRIINGAARFALMPETVKLQKVNYKGEPVGTPEEGEGA